MRRRQNGQEGSRPHRHLQSVVESDNGDAFPVEEVSSASHFAICDEAETRRLIRSKCIASIVLRPGLDRPLFLPSTLSQVSRIFTGRLPHTTQSIRSKDVHLLFFVADEGEESHLLARDAGKAAAELLGLGDPVPADITVEKVDPSPEDVARLLAEAGVVPFPRPNLYAVTDEQETEPLV